jgi:hypothetical protein
MLLQISAVPSAFGGEQPPAKSVGAEPARRSDPAGDKAKLKKLMAGVYLLCGVAAIGCLLLVGIVWQGARLRRMIRRPLPSAARGDELWFLKRAAGQRRDKPSDSSDSRDENGDR